MPTYNPERDYPPHEQDNPYYVNQFGYLQRPHPNTVAAIANAVERVNSIELPVKKRRPLKKPLRLYIATTKNRIKGNSKGKVVLNYIKCGPSYFPVNQ